MENGSNKSIVDDNKNVNNLTDIKQDENKKEKNLEEINIETIKNKKKDLKEERCKNNEKIEEKYIEGNINTKKEEENIKSEMKIENDGENNEGNKNIKKEEENSKCEMKIENYENNKEEENKNIKKEEENSKCEMKIENDEKAIKLLKEQKEYEKLYEQQQEKIKKEIEKEPLISKKLPIFILMDEFKENNIFLHKILDLMQNQKKSFIRKTRKDGSCFYRGFLFRIAELLIEDKNNFSKFKIFSKMLEAEKMMSKAGFEKLVFEDFQNLLRNYFVSIQSGIVTKTELLASLNEKSFFDYYIMYLRFLISAYIRINENLFEVYFPSDYHLKHFCTTQVEPIDAETDQIQIMALFNFFEIPIRIFYIDNSQGKFANCFSLPDIEGKNREKILETDKNYKIQFIYKPGHYDIIY